MHPVLAIGLALASAVCYAVSAALQHHEASRHLEYGLGLIRVLLRRPKWCTAQIASIAGALLHLGALGAGPLVLVQPIGVTALVFALPIGAWLGQVRVDRQSWIGAICVAVGLPAVLAMIPHHGRLGRGVLSYPTVVLAIGVLVAVAALVAVSIEGRRPRAAGVFYALGAALCFGLASGVVKAAWLHRAGPGLIVVGLVAMGTGVVLAQHAYRANGLGASLAVLTLADPLCAAGIGILVLGEPIRTSPLHLALGLSGIAVTTFGVALLSAHSDISRAAARDRGAARTAGGGPNIVVAAPRPHRSPDPRS